MPTENGLNCTLTQERYHYCYAIIPRKQHIDVELADDSVANMPMIMAHLTGSSCSCKFEFGVLKSQAPFEVIIGQDYEHIF